MKFRIMQSHPTYNHFVPNVPFNSLYRESLCLLDFLFPQIGLKFRDLVLDLYTVRYMTRCCTCKWYATWLSVGLV